MGKVVGAAVEGIIGAICIRQVPIVMELIVMGYIDFEFIF